MVNIWNYFVDQKVRVTDIDGMTTEGIIICIDDSDESTDLDARQEDSITIETQEGRCIGLYQSEISKIENILVLEELHYMGEGVHDAANFKHQIKMSGEKKANYRNPSLATLDFDALGPIECVTRWSVEGGTVEVTGLTQSKIEVIYRTSFNMAIKTGLLKVIKNRDSICCLWREYHMNDIDDTVRKIDKWAIEIVLNIAINFATTLMVLMLYGVL